MPLIDCIHLFIDTKIIHVSTDVIAPVFLQDGLCITATAAVDSKNGESATVIAITFQAPQGQQGSSTLSSCTSPGGHLAPTSNASVFPATKKVVDLKWVNSMKSMFAAATDNDSEYI